MLDVGDGEGDARVDHGVAYFDDSPVESPFRVVVVRDEWFSLAEAGPHSGGSLPERFKLRRKDGSAAASRVVLGSADDGLCGESGAEEQEGEQ